MVNTVKTGGDLNLPPPIIVYGVANIHPVQELLQDIFGDEYSMKLLANDQVEIQIKDESKIQLLAAGLRLKNTIFEITKKNKQETYKVILRNMHPSVDTDAIVQELRHLGHEVVSISNVRNPTTQEPMPLFNIELETRDNNEEIYSLTKLLHMIVAFEPQNQTKTTLQHVKEQLSSQSCDDANTKAEEPEKDAEKDAEKNAEKNDQSGSKPKPTATSDFTPPVAYVQPICSRSTKTRRQNRQGSASATTNTTPTNNSPYSFGNTAQEQMETLNRLTHLEGVVDTTLTSLEDMLMLTGSLTERFK